MHSKAIIGTIVKQHCTLLLFTAKDGKNKIQHKNICILPDCLKHNANTVYAFISNIMPFVKRQFPNLQLCYYCSDGAPNQYKNDKYFNNLLPSS